MLTDVVHGTGAEFREEDLKPILLTLISDKNFTDIF
jgi:hypothetical protein